MEWTVAAPFVNDETDTWLAPYVGGEHTLRTIPRVGEAVSWHDKKSPVTNRQEWMQFAKQGNRALRQTSGGVITVFPQLASVVGLQKQVLFRRNTPVVAWFFNTAVDTSRRAIPAKMALRAVDRLVVHTTREIGAYSSQLGLPSERFDFVPLQYGGARDTSELEEDEPFVFATGSGHRDYATFFDAIEKTGYRTLVLASEHALAGTTPPDNVTILDQISKAEIQKLVRRARINVVPMTLNGLTAGIVTVVEAYSHGRALVATERPGLEDYLVDNQTCLTVPHSDSSKMAEALEAMWTDDGLRNRLNKGAESFADEYCTDRAAGRQLRNILDSLVASH